ncbi:MAG TPA: hypothetical protein VIJ64_04630 [Candidatus Lustribacter sp.]
MIVRLPVYDERRRAFSHVRGERVLIYWPHGLGDFVHFGYVAPFLDPTNTYAITRFGDDFVHLYDGACGIEPVLSGVAAIGDGAAQGARHLGIDWKRIGNRPADVAFPEPLASRVRQRGISALLYTDYHEHQGERAFPFHTKARALIEQLADPQRLRAADLSAPLRNALSFQAPPPMRARVEARLRDLVLPGEALYLVAPGGHTYPAKMWPKENIRELIGGLPRFDPRARVLLVDDPTLRAAFGDLEVPFAHLLVTLIAAARALVGVPAGPLHAALAMRCCAVAGIWLAHHPDWYDEPNDRAIHLIGPLVARKRYERKKATATLPPALRARTIAFPDRIPRASDVLEALALMG